MAMKDSAPTMVAIEKYNLIGVLFFRFKVTTREV
jgi:hypothetical protein